MLFALAITAFADERAARLAELRAEVEELRREVQLDEADLRARLQSVDGARIELETAVRRDELELAQLRSELERAKARTADAGSDLEVLIPAVLEGARTLRPRVADGLPWRTAERLEALDAIISGLDAGTLPPHRAAARLWQVTEDELRLGRENALDRQVIQLDGAETYVETARLGMVALYFRAPDGRVGWAERGATGWTWRFADGRAATQQVHDLFDALGKQIRTGAFTLPNALPEVTP